MQRALIWSVLAGIAAVPTARVLEDSGTAPDLSVLTFGLAPYT